MKFNKVFCFAFTAAFIITCFLCCGGKKEAEAKTRAAVKEAPAQTAKAASDAVEPSYVGAKKCKMCHKGKRKGEQYELWQKRGHAKAFKTLQNEQSKEIAKKMGLGDPSTEQKCLKCHITAEHIKEEGVSCEACHGPGSLYKKVSIMKDEAKAKTLGLIEPDEQLCLKCHNKQSPTYKPFVFAEASKTIAHPLPGKGK